MTDRIEYEDIFRSGMRYVPVEPETARAIVAVGGLVWFRTIGGSFMVGTTEASIGPYYVIAENV